MFQVKYLNRPKFSHAKAFSILSLSSWKSAFLATRLEKGKGHERFKPLCTNLFLENNGVIY